MRIAMAIEYNGGPFSGWQTQKNAVTVQSHVEDALSKVAAEPVSVFCAGRTDTGVHATHQVIHFDTKAVRPERSWALGANVNLPHEVTVLWAKYVSDDFHARFSALSRTYRYAIFSRWVRPGLLNRRVTWVHQPLDADRMQAAANDLVGEHDFSSYRAKACQAKGPVREVHYIKVSRSGEYIYIDIQANAFLYHMVRNIAGVLITIGKGEAPVTWAKEVLELQDRALGGVTAVPDGLYFAGVQYPEQFDMPSSLSLPCFG